MGLVTFRLVNSRHEPVQDDKEVHVEFLPRKDDLLDLFDRLAVVTRVTHRIEQKPYAGGTEVVVTVIGQVY